MSIESVTLLFPGQGSQYVGMGKALEGHSSFELFAKANEVLGYDLSKICFEGPDEDLKLTANTQPAILTHSVATFQKAKEILEKKNIKIDRVLGHSVGEYAALVAAGALSFEDAVKSVNLRGKFMQEAVPAGKGKMYAILKLEQDIVEKACAEASNDEEKVMPANFNEPRQIVISGHAGACDRAVKWLEDNVEERFRAVELPVSAPFHCSLMQPAAENLAQHFNSINFSNITLPYVANVDAQEYDQKIDPNKIKENLVEQVCGSVLWTQSIQKLPAGTICLELGPGKVLAGLVRKINRDITVYSLDSLESFEKFEGDL